MIWVSLQSKSPGQRNDAITFFLNLSLVSLKVNDSYLNDDLSIESKEWSSQ